MYISDSGYINPRLLIIGPPIGDKRSLSNLEESQSLILKVILASGHYQQSIFFPLSMITTVTYRKYLILLVVKYVNM